jgi:hypothetical protein
MFFAFLFKALNRTGKNNLFAEDITSSGFEKGVIYG